MLKKYNEFINEEYKHTKSDIDVLNFIEKILKEDFSKNNFTLDSTHALSDFGLDRFKIKANPNHNTYIDLYFSMIEHTPKKEIVEKILNKILSSYDIYDIPAFDTGNKSFIITFNIHEISKSNLLSSVRGINKFNL